MVKDNSTAIFKYVNHASHGFPLVQKDGDAATDIRADEEVILAPGERRNIKTHIKLLTPPGYSCIFKERSGLAGKQGIEVLGGVIDPNFVRYVEVIILNGGDEPLYINPGDRIAQIVRVKVEVTPWEESPDVEDNGRAGHGASGIK